MNKEKSINLFICEDDEVGREIITKYFAKGKVTFAQMFPESKRKEIIEKLDTIEDNFLDL